MKRPMICFDVDGTLIDHMSHQVSDLTKRTIVALKKKGYRVIIATGRSQASLQSLGIVDLALWDGFVCNNGQTVFDGQGQLLFQAYMEKDSVLKVLEVAQACDYAVVIKSQQRVITKAADCYVYESQAFFNSQIPPLGTYCGQSVEAMVVYGPKGYDYEPFQEIPGITVLPGESTYCDLTIAGINKATGIQHLMALYACDQTIAFGDSLNDVDMFCNATLSVAMGQGNDYLKKLASYVTTSVYEDGIYHACIDLNILKMEEVV